MLSIFLLSSGLARAACFLPFTEAKCRPEEETGTNQLFERFCLASVDINNLINSLILGFQYAHYYAFLKSLFKKHCLPSNDLPSRDQRNIFFFCFHNSRLHRVQFYSANLDSVSNNKIFTRSNPIKTCSQCTGIDNIFGCRI